MNQPFSVVIPAKNEQVGLKVTLERLNDHYPNAEIIVVNDGSTDQTESVALAAGARVVNHLYSKGNGAAIKSGALAASHDVIVFMDGDGQHNPEDINTLLNKMNDGYDMVVGARDKKSQASTFRYMANTFYNLFATKMVGHAIPDLTSGFRAVKADLFREFIALLPNGFSYPTTITMAFFRAGYSVGYCPINVSRREGKSHIKLLSDGFKFILIIFKVATLYSPLKIFIPVSFLFFITGVSYYLYTYIEFNRFTNMSALLFSTSVIIFLMGLVSEQITTLMYMRLSKRS